jgi:hypothetical protein
MMLQKDEKDLCEAYLLNFTILSLNNEPSLLTGISTWPWRSGTFSGFLSALVLPIILFLIKLVIKKYMDG